MSKNRGNERVYRAYTCLFSQRPHPIILLTPIPASTSNYPSDSNSSVYIQLSFWLQFQRLHPITLSVPNSSTCPHEKTNQYIITEYPPNKEKIYCLFFKKYSKRTFIIVIFTKNLSIFLAILYNKIIKEFCLICPKIRRYILKIHKFLKPINFRKDVFRWPGKSIKRQ